MLLSADAAVKQRPKVSSSWAFAWRHLAGIDTSMLRRCTIQCCEIVHDQAALGLSDVVSGLHVE
jgi:hypothetical protein